MLVKRVDHRKGRFSLVIPAMNSFATHVEQKVVHPSHIPLQTESESAEVGRPGDTRPSSGFFRDGHDPRKSLITNFVKAFHEINGIEVLASAVDVRHPFSRFARVVEVKH
jgi:hypothetical protein